MISCGFVFQDDRASQHGLRSAKFGLPEVVADDGRKRSARTVLTRFEGSAENEWGSEHLEIIAAHGLAAEAGGRVTDPRVDGSETRAREAVEDLCGLIARIGVIGIRHIAERARGIGVPRPDRKQSLRSAHARGRPQQNGVHDCKKRRVRADAESKREDRYCRKAGRLRTA
jgi:hypothetical protein